MSSITAADLKLGGRLVAACDALGAGHLNRAAGIFAEIADDLNREATETGLLAEEPTADPDDWSAPLPAPQDKPLYEKMRETAYRSMAEPQDLQMCARNVHSFGAADPVSGWRTCGVCGQVNVAPPDNQGFVDVGIRQ